MKRIEFCKLHGFGNDYIVFEAEALRDVSAVPHDFAVRVCHRNYGIGGDGIAVLERLSGDAADYSCRIINPDGSEAGFSGNGTRCAVAYLYYKNLWQEKFLKLQTKSGVKTYEFLQRDEQTFWFRAELGKPKFALPQTYLSSTLLQEDWQPSGEIVVELSKAGIKVSLIFVDAGNPVACLFVQDFRAFDWRKIGEEIENLTEMFPERTNVVFIKPIDAENIEIRIWERGAGETSSSGTCSIAAAVTSAFTGKTNRKVFVHAPGGITEAEWRETDGEMLIAGRADLAFCGEWFEN